MFANALQSKKVCPFGQNHLSKTTPSILSVWQPQNTKLSSLLSISELKAYLYSCVKALGDQG